MTVSKISDAGGGHDGGDFGVMAGLVVAAAARDASLIRSGPRESLQSQPVALRGRAQPAHRRCGTGPGVAGQGTSTSFPRTWPA